MVSGVGANSPLAASISETPSEILFNANRLPDQVEVGLPVEVATGEADEIFRNRRRGPAPFGKADASLVVDAARDAVFATLDTRI